MSRATRTENDLLRAARAADAKGDTLRPWRGAAAAAERLCRRGLLVQAGTSAMPPHKVYVLTDAGRKGESHGRDDAN